MVLQLTKRCKTIRQMPSKNPEAKDTYFVSSTEMYMDTTYVYDNKVIILCG